MHSPITAIFLDIVENLKSLIAIILRWQVGGVNNIKTTFHYLFELEHVPLFFLSSEFHFHLQPDIKFSCHTPITH